MTQLFTISCTSCNFTCTRAQAHGKRVCPMCKGKLKSEAK